MAPPHLEELEASDAVRQVYLGPPTTLPYEPTERGRQPHPKPVQSPVSPKRTDVHDLHARRAAPEVLMDTTEDDDRPVPYFEVSNSIWASTGYGSLLAGPDDSLVLRVGRGDFSRSVIDSARET
ncbi:hypothetical protein ACFPH6_10545 [Streptomyces xiangluensis]|uniref:Uncharacterized protein n=1 Tax=Streptomyces xiangluensis TaxID=2665720 RepID=A0ABV8YKT2_9ACTN